METIGIRFEHPTDGQGIYNSSVAFLSNEMSWYRTMRLRHCNQLDNPNEDRKLRGICTEEFCAFNSIEQLKTLISEIEYLKLIMLGFKVYEITLSICRVGDSQILYEKNNVIKKKDITEEIY